MVMQTMSHLRSEEETHPFFMGSVWGKAYVKDPLKYSESNYITCGLV